MKKLFIFLLLIIIPNFTNAEMVCGKNIGIMLFPIHIVIDNNIENERTNFRFKGELLNKGDPDESLYKYNKEDLLITNYFKPAGSDNYDERRTSTSKLIIKQEDENHIFYEVDNGFDDIHAFFLYFKNSKNFVYEKIAVGQPASIIITQPNFFIVTETGNCF